MHLTPTVTIDRMAWDGAGETRYNGKTLRVFGMLPGESGVVEVRRRKGVYVGTLKELLHASSDRVLPIDSHYLSSSPWQCMTYPAQAAYKSAMLSERYAFYPDAPKPEFVCASAFSGYRTKMEFSVMEESGSLVLAFHQRGGGKKLLSAQNGSILASSRMNHAAQETLSMLDGIGYTERDIKAIVVRESKATGKVLGIAYVTREDGPIPGVIPEVLSGFFMAFSDPRSPASIVTKVLAASGEGILHERIRGRTFAYPWDGFFQNNVPMFELALDDIERALIPGAPLLDLFAGVGTIGISMIASVPSVLGIEVVESATPFIRSNAQDNGTSSVTAELLPSERIPETILAAHPNVIVDPPRAGLHPKLISAIVRTPPARLVYLSCNPETQARDYAQLAAQYRIERIVGYDFYPQTPHLESLLVLSRREVPAPALDGVVD